MWLRESSRNLPFMRPRRGEDRLTRCRRAGAAISPRPYGHAPLQRGRDDPSISEAALTGENNLIRGNAYFLSFSGASSVR